jgi:predicted dehydrogenase
VPGASARSTLLTSPPIPKARLNTIVETDRAAAERLAGQYGAVLRDQGKAFADPAIDAVLVASSTDTHADLVEAAARAGKAIFCEKPLDLDRRRAEAPTLPLPHTCARPRASRGRKSKAVAGGQGRALGGSSG